MKRIASLHGLALHAVSGERHKHDPEVHLCQCPDEYMHGCPHRLAEGGVDAEMICDCCEACAYYCSRKVDEEK